MMQGELKTRECWWNEIGETDELHEEPQKSRHCPPLLPPWRHEIRTRDPYKGKTSDVTTHRDGFGSCNLEVISLSNHSSGSQSICSEKIENQVCGIPVMCLYVSCERKEVTNITINYLTFKLTSLCNNFLPGKCWIRT